MNKEVIEIDARGMKCPRPIIEIAKTRRKVDPGQVISIMADDLAFESDVRAWCDTTGNTLKEINKDGNVVKAVIEISRV
jgi:TusA-related sulfurtransferase